MVIEEDKLVSKSSIHAPDMPFAIPLNGPGISVRAARSGESQLVPDVREDPDRFEDMIKIISNNIDYAVEILDEMRSQIQPQRLSLKRVDLIEIIHEAVEAYGGYVSYKSGEDEGSIFTFVLPRGGVS